LIEGNFDWAGRGKLTVPNALRAESVHRAGRTRRRRGRPVLGWLAALPRKSSSVQRCRACATEGAC
jgi:hypothetical protein